MGADPIRALRLLSSVRVRVTLIALAVVAVTFAFGGFALEWQVQRSLTNNINSLVNTEAGDVAAIVANGSVPPHLVANRPGIGVQIVDAHHQVLASTAELQGRPAVAAALPPAGQTLTMTGRKLLPGSDDADIAVAMSVATPHGTRTIYVLSTTEQAEDTAHDLVLPLIVILPLLALVVGVLVWWLVGWALRPVEAIRAQVAEISGGDLHRRVTEPPVDDEIGRLARTMNAMLGRIESSAERQARFVSDASHELRSPLAALLAQLEVARSHPTSADWQRVADVAIDDGRRLERIVNDLLLLARSDEGHLHPAHQRVDLDELVLAEAERLRGRGRVHVDIHAVGAGRVDGDRDLLQRVVRNLAENAERHTHRVVAFGVRHRGRVVELVVTDDGPGIPADQRTKVFERFTRLDEGRSRPSGGTGLGLAIVGEIVVAHGGKVQVGDSEVGTRMVVHLPAANDEADPPIDVARHADREPGRASRSPIGTHVHSV
jgi:heavy metal sensor kinase